MSLKQALTIVIMGVSGCGKSTVGRLVAERTDSRFMDADDFHPQQNRTKMTNGEPLTDEDRKPWLKILGEEISRCNDAGQTVVLACSALKESYREQLRSANPRVAFVHLHGDQPLIEGRLKKRRNHFFPPSLLKAQFADLEPPEDALTLHVSASPDEIVSQIVTSFSNQLP